MDFAVLQEWPGAPSLYAQFHNPASAHKGAKYQAILWIVIR
jgi:hypothetical protein